MKPVRHPLDLPSTYLPLPLGKDELFDDVWRLLTEALDTMVISDDTVTAMEGRELFKVAQEIHTDLYDGAPAE